MKIRDIRRRHARIPASERRRREHARLLAALWRSTRGAFARVDWTATASTMTWHEPQKVWHPGGYAVWKPVPYVFNFTGTQP